MIEVAISVNLAWRWFWADCNNVVVVVGLGAVPPCCCCCCWYPGTEGMTMVFPFPKTLTDASMWTVMGLEYVSYWLSSSSRSMSLLWAGTGGIVREYGGGGTVEEPRFCILAATSASFWD